MPTVKALHPKLEHRFSKVSPGGCFLMNEVSDHLFMDRDDVPWEDVIQIF